MLHSLTGAPPPGQRTDLQLSPQPIPLCRRQHPLPPLLAPAAATPAGAGRPTGQPLLPHLPLHSHPAQGVSGRWLPRAPAAAAGHPLVRHHPAPALAGLRRKRGQQCHGNQPSRAPACGAQSCAIGIHNDGVPLKAPLPGHTIAGHTHCPTSFSLHLQLTSQVGPLWNGRQLGAPQLQPPQLAWADRQGLRQRTNLTAARAAASAAAGIQPRSRASPAGAARRKRQARQLGRCRQQFAKKGIPAASARGAAIHLHLSQAGQGAATAGQRATSGELQPSGRRPRRQQCIGQVAQRWGSRPQACNVQHRGAGAMGVGGAVGTGSHLCARDLHIVTPLGGHNMPLGFRRIAMQLELPHCAAWPEGGKVCCSPLLLDAYSHPSPCTCSQPQARSQR